MKSFLAAILVMLGLGGAILGGIATTQIDTEVDFVDTVPDHPGLDPYRRILTELDGIRFAAIYMAVDEGAYASLRDDGFDQLVLEQQDLTGRMLKAHPEIQYTLSAYEGMRQGNYMFQKLLLAGNQPDSAYSLPSDPLTYEAVKGQILGDDTLDDVLSRAGDSALMLFFLSEDAPRDLVLDIDATLQDWAASPTNHPATQEHASTGLLYASSYTDQVNREEITFYAPIALGASILVAGLFLRRIDALLIAVIGTAAPLAWTFGTLVALDIPVSFLTFALAPVVLGVGIDGTIHFLLREQALRAEISDPGARIRRTYQQMTRPILTAGLTTAAGLAVLLFVPAPLFSQIGGVTALGMVYATLAQLTLVPALRRVIPSGSAAPTGRPKRGLPAGGALLAVGTLILVASLGGVASQVEQGSGNSDNEFPQDDPVIALQARIEEEYGAFQRAYLIFEGDITQPAVIEALYQATNQSSSLPLFRGASSVADLLIADDSTDQGFLDIALSGLLGGAGMPVEDEDRLPQTREEAKERLDALFADPLWRTIAPFTISSDYDLAIVAITIHPWNSTAELLELRDALVALGESVQSELGSAAIVTAGGSPNNRAAIVDQTPNDVLIATAGSTAAVLLVILLTQPWRGGWNVRLALIGAVLTLGAAIVLTASVGILDAIYDAIASNGGAENSALLNNMFLLAFAITMAVAVDDLIHVASAIRRAGFQDGLREALRPVLATTLTGAAAFAAMTPIYFLQSKNLAILATVGILTGLALTIGFGIPLLRDREDPVSPDS